MTFSPEPYPWTACSLNSLSTWNRFRLFSLGYYYYYYLVLTLWLPSNWALSLCDRFHSLWLTGLLITLLLLHKAIVLLVGWLFIPCTHRTFYFIYSYTHTSLIDHGPCLTILEVSFLKSWHFTSKQFRLQPPKARVPNLQDLMPNDLRWSWCNNRSKVHNKRNALESSENHPLNLVCGEIAFHEISPWCQKGRGLLP